MHAIAGHINDNMIVTDENYNDDTPVDDVVRAMRRGRIFDN